MACNTSLPCICRAAIKNWGYQGKGRAAMMVLKNTILPRILLRRTKVWCLPLCCSW